MDHWSGLKFLNVLLHTVPRHFLVSVHTLMGRIPGLALSLGCKNPWSPITSVPKASTVLPASIRVFPSS